MGHGVVDECEGRGGGGAGSEENGIQKTMLALCLSESTSKNCRLI